MASLPTDGVKSTTIEAALLEFAILMQMKEATPSNNPQNLNNVQVTVNVDSGTVTISAQLPVSEQVNPDGSIGFTVEPYLT